MKKQKTVKNGIYISKPPFDQFELFREIVLQFMQNASKEEIIEQYVKLFDAYALMNSKFDCSDIYAEFKRIYG